KSLGSQRVSHQCINTLKLTRLNDRIPKYLPAQITVAHKTGLERNVCHDAGVVFTCKGDFIIVALTKHANSNGASSKEFIAKVALLAYNYFE
ncbi:MAG: serine hydrolase, partial [Candidatus Omnitrophica bacterium]|nr:serine hydrolase [Candidatus Omnitrophota bacterium]